MHAKRPVLPDDAPGPLRLAPGALAGEELLLAELERLLPARQAGNGPMPPPLWLVVPSVGLRSHLLARVVERRGAVAGLNCLTLFALAVEVCDRAGWPAVLAPELLPLLARRFARREPALRQPLEPLEDGYAGLWSSVAELLDAGFQPAHGEALEEVLAEEGPGVASTDEVQRARALVRVAAATVTGAAELGVVHAAELFQRAAELIRLERPLGDAPILIYGFATATGAANDLLEALVAAHAARAVLAPAPDPAAPDQDGPLASGEPAQRSYPGTHRQGLTDHRLIARLAGAAGIVAGPRPPATRPRIEMFHAPGHEAEAREVARRLLALLESGFRPQWLAVVARRLDGSRSALRTQFARLGIPFSASPGSGPLETHGRRLAALAELLRQREETAIERWLDAAFRPPGAGRGHDLRLALHTLGAARLGQVEAVAGRVAESGRALPLPVRRRYEVRPRPSGESGGLTGAAGGLQVRLRRRKLPASDLRAATEAAGALVEALAAWSEPAPLAAHRATLRRLLVDLLAWPAEDPLTGDVLDLVARVESGLAAGFDLEPAELLALLEPGLRRLATGELGGAGAGVQVLDAEAARGRTFEHLFLIGLNRDVFPRPPGDDPLLPDALRRVLARSGHGVLPDLPTRRDRAARERELFCQLLAAAPRITLSWLTVDDDGAELAVSPLVERLRWAPKPRPAGWRTPPTAPPLWAPGAVPEPRPAFESAVLTALHGPRQRLGRALHTALGDLGNVAAARARILDEWDPPAGWPSRPGPWDGFLGQPGDADPRRQDPVYVTTLEQLATCPWRLLVERLLRLERVPDPLEGLPGIDPLLVGQLVHRVLAELVGSALQGSDPTGIGPTGAGPLAPATLDEVRGRPPSAVGWPEAGELDELLAAVAEATVRERGIVLPGFAALLAAAARGHLESARRLDWETGPVPAVGTEVEGRLPARWSPGGAPAVAFRADRADHRGGRLVLTDYKTGRRAVSDARQARTRRRHLVLAVARGERLQAAAYALAGGEPPLRGRYLFLDPRVPEIAREAIADGNDPALAAAFEEALGATLTAWRAGSFFPRLVDPERDEEPRLCRFCGAAEACLRGDSGARGRLRRWAVETLERPPGEPQLAAAAELWRLPAARRGRHRKDG